MPCEKQWNTIFFRENFNSRDLKMNRLIVAATPIAAPDRDLPGNIRSHN